MLSKTDVTLQDKERKLLNHQTHFASQQALMSISNSCLCTCEQWQQWPRNCDTSGFFSAAMSTCLLGRFSSLGLCRSCCWLFSIGISCCVIDKCDVYNYKDRHLGNTIHITPQKKDNNSVYPSSSVVQSHRSKVCRSTVHAHSAVAVMTVKLSKHWLSTAAATPSLLGELPYWDFGEAAVGWPDCNLSAVWDERIMKKL